MDTYQSVLKGVGCLLAVVLVCGLLRVTFQTGREWESYQRLRDAVRRGDVKVPHWTKGGWQ